MRADRGGFVSPLRWRPRPTGYLSFDNVISHDRRRIEHWNVTRHPTAAWLWQQLVEATAWGRPPRFLIRDRDRCFGGDFVARAAGIGITTILTPVRAPNANAIAERVIGTLRRECFDHLTRITSQVSRLSQ